MRRWATPPQHDFIVGDEGDGCCRTKMEMDDKIRFNNMDMFNVVVGRGTGAHVTVAEFFTALSSFLTYLSRGVYFHFAANKKQLIFFFLHHFGHFLSGQC